MSPEEQKRIEALIQAEADKFDYVKALKDIERRELYRGIFVLPRDNEEDQERA